MASRSLDDLIPPVKSRAIAFLKACDDAGLDIMIYCTYRSPEEQNELYAQGRTVKSNIGVSPLRPMGAIVTNAKGGQSWHNYRAAFDFVPLVNGKPAWSDGQLYAKAGEIAESCGLEWAGRWQGKLRETAHCQYRGGLSLEQAADGKVIV